LKIKEADDFLTLKDEWNILLKNNLLGDNVFLTWEWLSTWWKHFREGRKLLVLLVEDENEVLAIAPLMLSKYKLPGFGSIKKIEFLGARHSDYSNFLILKKERESLRLIVDYLKDIIADWDWIELKEIPETAENADFLETLFSGISSELRLKKRVCNICPYISLPNASDLLMNGMNKKIRKNLKYYLKKLERERHVELKKYDEVGFSVKEAMEVFIRLNEDRWASEGLPGSFESKEDAFRKFHMDIAVRFAEEGWLGLYFLTANDEPVSVQYDFEYGQKMYYYLGGFDPRYSDYSVGNLLKMFLLKRCIEKGLKEYDMMRGDEPYKTMWTHSYRRNFEIRLVREGLISGFYDWVTWNNTVFNLAEKLKLSLKRSYT
jgi:CelD/BcsL family acetyltransferase involved in cellulose biosynthesis